MRPAPISARRLNKGADCATTSRRFSQKFLERSDDKPIGLLRADGHAQRVWELVDADVTQHEPACGEESVSLLGRTSFGFGKVDQQEICDAWSHFKTEFLDLPR